MNYHNVIKTFKEVFDPANIKHIAFNYSESEVGLRHPDLPAGLVVRDQFQTEMFTGRSRIILTGEEAYHTADVFAILAQEFIANVEGIENFTINGKHVDKQLFYSQPVLAAKPDFDPSTVSLIGSATKIFTPKGEECIIVNTVPLSNVVDVKSIFVENANTSLLSPEVEAYNVIKEALGL